MTFDNWFVNRFSNPDDLTYIWCEEAWNAAIASSLKALDAAAEAAQLKPDPYVSNEEVLKKLLTE